MSHVTASAVMFAAVFRFLRSLLSHMLWAKMKGLKDHHSKLDAVRFILQTTRGKRWGTACDRGRRD
jgi:hypothetical protein